MKYFAALLAVALSVTPGQAIVAPVAAVTLAAKGLTLGKATLRFGTPRAQAIKLAAAVLGVPIKTGVYPECGSGHAIGYAKFRGGIELSFVGGKLVGWTLDYGGDKRIRTANGAGIGTTAAALRKLFPDVFIDPGNEEGGGLGPNFTSDTWVNGWLDGSKQTSKVISLYAGETCIVE